MGQKLKDDKIGTLSQSGGIVYLAPSILTIGGQQYNITSTLQVTLTGLSALTLYNFYVVLSSNIPTLVYSTNNNSVGPTGYASWKLVGAFYSNYNSSFTGFLDIERPLDLDISVSGAYNILNSTITGYVALLSNSDNYGLITPESGAYTASTGQFATRQPRITMPLAGVFTATWEVGWSTAGFTNFTNTWSMIMYKNGSSTGSLSRNADSGNGSGSLQFMFQWKTERVSAAAGDFFEFKILNDMGNFSCGIRTALFNFKSTKAIKDL